MFSQVKGRRVKQQFRCPVCCQRQYFPIRGTHTLCNLLMLWDESCVDKKVYISYVLQSRQTSLLVQTSRYPYFRYGCNVTRDAANMWWSWHRLHMRKGLHWCVKVAVTACWIIPSGLSCHTTRQKPNPAFFNIMHRFITTSISLHQEAASQGATKKWFIIQFSAFWA